MCHYFFGFPLSLWRASFRRFWCLCLFIAFFRLRMVLSKLYPPTSDVAPQSDRLGLIALQTIGRTPRAEKKNHTKEEIHTKKIAISEETVTMHA